MGTLDGSMVMVSGQDAVNKVTPLSTRSFQRTFGPKHEKRRKASRKSIYSDIFCQIGTFSDECLKAGIMWRCDRPTAGALDRV
jgi:hypothetical protein